MDLHASFSIWTPEIYLRVGSAHFYASLWKALLLVALIWIFGKLSSVDREAEPVRHSHTRAGFLLALLAYGLAILWPFGIAAVTWPWNGVPGAISYEERLYGTGQGTPDPRVDTYGCNSERSIRTGSFTAEGSADIDRVEQVGHLVGVLGGPALYVAHEGTGGWLVVRPTADCWIPYPEWI